MPESQIPPEQFPPSRIDRLLEDAGESQNILRVVSKMKDMAINVEPNISLKRFDPTNETEIEQVIKMFGQEKAKQLTGVVGSNPKNEALGFMVDSSAQAIYWKDETDGQDKLVGFINIYDPDPKFVKKINQTDEPLPKDSLILEISYLTDSNEKKLNPATVVAALMVTEKMLSHNLIRLKKLSDQKEKFAKPKITLIAATADNNLPSTLSLLAAGYRPHEIKSIYDEEEEDTQSSNIFSKTLDISAVGS